VFVVAKHIGLIPNARNTSAWLCMPRPAGQFTAFSKPLAGLKAVGQKGTKQKEK